MVLHALERGAADGAIVTNDLVLSLDLIQSRPSLTESETSCDISL
jgi:hypothetical protein